MHLQIFLHVVISNSTLLLVQKALSFNMVSYLADRNKKRILVLFLGAWGLPSVAYPSTTVAIRGSSPGGLLDQGIEKGV